MSKRSCYATDTPSFVLTARTLRYTLLCWMLCLMASVTPAQDTPQETPPISEELERLKADNEVLAEKLKRAESQKKLLDLYIPKSSTKLPEGKLTTTGDAMIESEILTYQVMKDAATGFSERIALKKDMVKRVLIYDKEQLDSIFYYQAYLANLQDLERRYKELFPPTTSSPEVAAALIIPAITAALGAAADIAAFFKTDTEITSNTFELSESVLIAQVANNLLEKGIEVMNPAVFAPNLLTEKSDVLDKINTLHEQKRRADKKVAELAQMKKPFDEKVAELNIEIERTPEGQARNVLVAQRNAEAAKSKDLAGQIAPYKDANQLYELLVTNLLRPPGDTEYKTFVRIMRAEWLQQSIGDGCYTLKLEITKAGGNTKITKRTFRSPTMHHSGGVVANFTLYSRDGKVVLTGEDHRYKGYVKVKSKEEENSNLQISP